MRTIVIPVKTNSTRCPGKNKVLLPFTLEFIKKNNLLDITIVISDSDAFKDICDKYNVKYIISDNKGEYKTIFDSVDTEEIIWLPATQPSRCDDLINKAIEANISNCDLITSYVTMPDRTIFEIQDNSFVIKDIERKGVLCKEKQIADGAIYYTTKTFLKKVITSDNQNKTFWNGNTKFIKNEAPFVDIDYKEDLEKFINYYKH